MLRRTLCLLTLTAALATGTARAADPPMGGPMNHIMVTLEENVITLHVQREGPMRLQNYGETYDGAGAVLDGMYFKAPDGWMVGGFWEPPEGSSVWIRRAAHTEGLEAYRMGTFSPIFTEDGALFEWGGMMTHNWYAATEPGPYEATYDVYIGDAEGEPLADYEGASITLDWELILNGDVTRDGVVDFGDVLRILADWGVCEGCPSDLNGDGMADFADVLIVLANWS